MVKDLLTPDYIFESSWEVCNKVGGIYTVLSTRANTLQEKFRDRIFFIGPDVWQGKENPLFIESDNLCAAWKKHAFEKDELSVRVGRWNIPGEPIVILVDFQPFFEKKDDIYTDMWNRFKVDSLHAYGDMPEFGMMFKLDADYDNVTWYGMGPEETYVDRCAGAKLGVYKNKVEDNMAKYLVPQECGNKVGVRWATVTNRKGRGMMFSGDKMEFSALPYTPHELENAMHPYELPQVHYTVVRVAKQQMGVGGDDSWGAQTHPEYLIPVDQKLEFTFTFRGI